MEDNIYEITLENNKVYIVVDSFIINNNKYLFLIGELDRDLALVKYYNDVLVKIKDDKEYDSVFELLYDRNKDKIDKLLNEE